MKQQVFCILDFSNFLESPPHFSAYSQFHVHCPLRTTLPDLLGIHPQSGWKFPRPRNSCILHVCITSTTWMMPQSSTSSCCRQEHLDHGSRGLCVYRWLNTVKEIPTNQFPRYPFLSSGLRILTNESFTVLQPQVCKEWDLLESWDTFKVSFLFFW